MSATAEPVSLGEIQTIVAARSLAAKRSCFIGVGRPSTAALLAREIANPDLVLVYESGTIGAKPYHVPLSIGDGELAETADFVVSVPEMFNYWIGPGRIQVAVLGAAQIDRYANLNSTDLGVLEPRDGELTLTATHPGVTVEEVQAATGWELRLAPDIATTAVPSREELKALRELVSRA